jgi:dTDP-4-dehydrorhamnose reductase
MSKNIIVLGANGMAGHVITLGLQEAKHYIISVARTTSKINPSVLLDVSDFAGLKSLINSVNPDLIINCIGLLNKTAEDNPAQAVLINSYLPHFLESETKYTKSKVIHISTDCVFSGDTGSYTEKSLKDGKGYYAQSKALGELDNSKDLTFRTSIIGPELNENGIGLFHWFINQHSEIKGYTKAFWTGVTTIELLNAIKCAIKEDLTGLFHLVYDQKISKCELLKILNKEFEQGLKIISDDKYSVDKSLINTRTDFKFKVKSYADMIREMKSWILSHKELYAQYKSIRN